MNRTVSVLSFSASVLLLCLLAGCSDPAVDGDHNQDAGQQTIDARTNVENVDGRSVDGGNVDADGSDSSNRTLTLGKVTSEKAINTCPVSEVPTDACIQVFIDGCTQVDASSVQLKISEPSGPVAGTVVLGVGGAGGAFYEKSGPPNDALIMPLLAAGYRVVQRAWKEHGWFPGVGGGSPALQACRYATLLTYLHKQRHTGGGFCVSGNSGGSSEIGYALSRYGLGSIIDLAVPTGGSPMGRIDYGCGASPSWLSECSTLQACSLKEGRGCTYNANQQENFDTVFEASDAPCVSQTNSAAWSERWREGSIYSGDAVLDFPQTEVHQINGANDCTEALPIGLVWFNAITSTKKLVVAADTPHQVPSTIQGATAIRDALLTSCINRH